ncbi:MAG: serine hydrolase domain-containing protein [Planctomycetota bacterium]
MKPKLLVLLVLLTTACGQAAQGTAVAPAGSVEGARAKVRAAVQAEFERQRLVGLAVAVVEDGEIAEHYFGAADREAGVPVDAGTLFRWASISKPVTAVAAVQLVRAGALDLDLDVRDYVPEFPPKPWPITARQLLQHRAGIVHYRNGKVVRTERDYDAAHPFADVVTALDTFKASPLIAEPGAKFSYTTHGYILLGAVVQRAGKAAFRRQVADRVARPLGMTTFRPDDQWEEIAGRAVGYRRVVGLTFRSSNTDVSWKLPGGGFLSNVGDLARFARGLLGDDLLTDDEKAQMWAPQAAPETESGTYPYGLGFGVRVVDGRLRVSHSGSQEKTKTLMQLDPERGRAVVAMSNSEWASLREVIAAARRSLLQ